MREDGGVKGYRSENLGFFEGWQPLFSELTVTCYAFCNISAKWYPPDNLGMKKMLVMRYLWKQKGRENTKIYKERVALDGTSPRSVVTFLRGSSPAHLG